MVRVGDQKMVAATFRHDTSRNLDPELYTHAVIANMVQGGDGKCRTMVDDGLFNGLGPFGDRFTGTPNLGFGLSDTAREYRIGWRLASEGAGRPWASKSISTPRGGRASTTTDRCPGEPTGRMRAGAPGDAGGRHSPVTGCGVRSARPPPIPGARTLGSASPPRSWRTGPDAGGPAPMNGGSHHRLFLHGLELRRQ